MELTNIALQSVSVNNNVLFAETPVKGSKCIQHREGSGIVTLRGLTNQCKARYLVEYSGNIGIPTTGTAEEISLAIAINGEPLLATKMVATPTVTGSFFNVSGMTYVEVPQGCCATISVENTSTQAIDVANSNIIVTRVA